MVSVGVTDVDRVNVVWRLFPYGARFMQTCFVCVLGKKKKTGLISRFAHFEDPKRELLHQQPYTNSLLLTSWINQPKVTGDP